MSSSFQGDCGDESLDVYTEELETFVHAVIHDMRSPLVNIRALAGELRFAMEDLRPLKSSLHREIPSEQREKMLVAAETDIPDALQHIDTCISRMDRVMNGLVAFSRSVHREFEWSPLNLGEIVHAVVEEFAVEIERSECVVEVGGLPRIRGDGDAMHCVFGHLLRNALQNFPPDRAGARRVRIAAVREEEYHLVTVSDNGRGISREHVERAFRPFGRIAGSDGSGDGIGLTIVRALLRRHRGTIACFSIPGEGTRFTLRFPVESDSASGRG